MRARNTTDISPIGVLMLDVKQVAASCGIGTSTVWKLPELPDNRSRTRVIKVKDRMFC